jgi:peptidylprolyl isomerase
MHPGHKSKGYFMSEAKNGNTVKVHYTGTLKSGEKFDSSRDRDPLEFKLGEGRVIPGFENAVLGMKTGESTKVEIASDQAYGKYDVNLLIEVDRKTIPANIDLKPNIMLESVQSDGRKIPVKVVKVTDDKVTVDANHPLAGEDLVFEIELVEIQ